MKPIVLAPAAATCCVLVAMATAASPEIHVGSLADSLPAVITDGNLPRGKVLVELHEGLTGKQTWDFERPPANARFWQPTFALVGYPKKGSMPESVGGSRTEYRVDVWIF